MLSDFRRLDSRVDLDFDVCIVGAGPAGITLAREIGGGRMRVCLLESGGLEPEAELVDLNAGENVGLDLFDLRVARQRFLGGASNHWGGWCAPLDPDDFEGRDWVPYSGWPIRRADLDPYYERAQLICDLGTWRYDESLWSELGRAGLPFDGSRLVTRFWQFSGGRSYDRSTRFGVKYRSVLEASVDVHVFLYANVIELRSNREGNRIESVDAVALDGTARRIRARWYVLAAGAIENARLLLASNRVEAHGIGNRHDLVGRFFMEHPRATVGEVWSRQGRKLLETYDYCPFGKTDVLPGIATSPRLTQEKRILSGCMTLLDEVGPGQSMRATSALDFEDLLQVRRDLEPPAPEPPPRRASRPDQSESTGIWIVVRSEQAPSPDSRITLSQERDSAGQRRVRLDLRFSPQDKRTLRVMAETLGAELGRLGMGRVWLAEVFRRSDDDWSGVPGLRVGFHHMGTTRMADDPRKGVVDADCRVHGIANLYVTGSSVFVTGGWANPTLTVVALALRLAAHLKRIAS